MEAILKCIDDVEVHIDDVGIFSLSWEDHMRTLDVVCAAQIQMQVGHVRNRLACILAHSKRTEAMG